MATRRRPTRCCAGQARRPWTSSGEYWSLIEGRLQRRAESPLGKVRAALEAAGVLSQPDMSLEDFLAGDHGRALPEEARTMARSFVSGFDAADPRLVSLHSVAEEWRAGGMLDSSQSRPLGGYRPALLALGAGLDGSACACSFRPSSPRSAGAIAQWRSKAYGSANRSAPRARKAIVTVPIGVLKAAADAPGAIDFVPRLEAKQDALTRLISGPVAEGSPAFSPPVLGGAGRRPLRGCLVLPRGRQGISDVLDDIARARAASQRLGRRSCRGAPLRAGRR